MRIAVIGQGNIGGTLGDAFARAGHSVSIGSRHPETARDGTAGPAVLGIGAAIADADAVLLALPAAAVEELLAEHGAALNGKLVIDATNRMGAPVANAAAAVRAAAPGAHYVRAFNSLGWENFADPLFDGVAADLFFSAPAEYRAAVETLIADVGLRPAYLGADKEDVVDQATLLWFALVHASGNRRTALRVLSK